MREDLMQELRRVTEEEERLLAGGQVDKSLYTSGSVFLIDSEKLLAKGLKPSVYISNHMPNAAQINGSALENYEKSLDVFFDLLPHQQEAVKRAEKRSEQLRRDGTEILTRASNPATTVHKLVTYLIGQSR